MSFVLNDHPNAAAIPEATRRRVLATAEALGYTPSPEARALRAGRSDVVLCLMPNWPITGPFGVLLQGLSSELYEVGLTMLVHQRSPGEDLTQVFSALTPTAVVAVGELSQSEVDLADRRGITVISFMGDVPDREDLSALKQSEIGKLQARELTRHGHRSLAYVSPFDPMLDWFSTPRLDGAREATRKAGGTLVHHRLAENSGEDAPTWLAEAVTAGLTGICAYNDEVALALMMAAAELHLAVPEDISLVGVDDSPLSKFARPELTTIGFRLAKEAKRLASIIVGNQSEQARPRASTLMVVKRRATVRTLVG